MLPVPAPAARLLPTFGLALGLLLFASPALPQASTGTLRGTVRDQSAAVVPRAVVTLTNLQTDASSHVATNEVGVYVFPALVPGRYSLAVESPGMRTFEGTLALQVAQDAVIDPVLEIGQSTSQVVVRDVTPLVAIGSSDLGHSLERPRIEALPVNGRNILNLLNTVPGMEGGSTIRVYGLKQGADSLIFDGSVHNENWQGYNQQIPPNLDSIQEFRVETNNPSAKYSRPVTIEMSSRSGTNQLHAALFEVNRNSGYGVARARQDTFTKPPYLNRNEFGVSAGGPAYLPGLYDGRNRTFWFFSWEDTRTINPTTQGWSVPTQAMRNGDFSGLVDSLGRLSVLYDPLTTDPKTWSRQPFSYGGKINNIDPNRISPLAKQLYSITPLPTLPNVNPLLGNNWYGLAPAFNIGYTTSTRFDHRFTPKDPFYARYTHGLVNQLYQFGSQPMLNLVPGASRRRSPNQSLAMSWTHLVSPTLFNSFTVSGSRDLQYRGNGDFNEKYSTELGLPNPFDRPGWPNITGTGIPNYAFNTDVPFSIPYTYVVLEDHVTKIKGRHELQFGLHFRYDQSPTSATSQYAQGLDDFSTLATSLYDPNSGRTNPLATSLTGSDAANMFLGVADYQAWFNRNTWYLRSREYAAYALDNFKLTPRLTLNLGLRYEIRTPISEKHNMTVGYDPQQNAMVLGNSLSAMEAGGYLLDPVVNYMTSLGTKFIGYQQSSLPRSLMYTNWHNFGPRLGFSYQLQGGDHPTVLRGGYGVSFYPTPLSAWADDMGRTAPEQAPYTISVNAAAEAPDGIPNYGLRSVPTTFAGLNSSNTINIKDTSALYPGFATLTFLDPHQPDVTVQSWNMTLEKEVTRDTVARVAYVGDHSSNLENQVRMNEAPSAYLWYTTTGKALPTGTFSGVATRPFGNTVFGRIQEFSKLGWSNFNGMQFELERRFNHGLAWQFFYVLSNDFAAGGLNYNSPIAGVNEFLPGAVPTDVDQRNRFLNYQRDTTIPKHRVRWNWLADLPIGRGKLLARNAHGVANKLLGGWQVAGQGYLASTFFTMPTANYPSGNPIQIYGYKYPIQNCTSGACLPGYLWWNGYISPPLINRVNAAGQCTGICGVPADYKPAQAPLVAYGATSAANAPAGTNMTSFWDTNTVWVPLTNGTVARTTYNDNLNPYRNQYFPSVLQWGMDASLLKNIALGERANLRFSIDCFNVLNHPNNPSAVSANGILATNTSGSSPRQTQLGLRLSW